MLGARIGVMDRTGGDVRWFAVEPCHLSHSVNAHDSDDGVVLTGTRLPRPDGLPVLHEWRLDETTGRVHERPLADVVSEYPRLHDGRIGRHHRYTYTSGFWFEAEPHHGEIHKHDGTGRTTYRLPEPIRQADLVSRTAARSERVPAG